MTPKEKAEELFDKYYNYTADMGDPNECAKQCALIAADEIIKDIYYNPDRILSIIRTDYWQEVKQEIEKL